MSDRGSEDEYFEVSKVPHQSVAGKYAETKASTRIRSTGTPDFTVFDLTSIPPPNFGNLSNMGR